eukprot:7073704-Pyramimonas_sp.AAC.1
MRQPAPSRHHNCRLMRTVELITHCEETLLARLSLYHRACTTQTAPHRLFHIDCPSHPAVCRESHSRANPAFWVTSVQGHGGPSRVTLRAPRLGRAVIRTLMITRMMGVMSIMMVMMRMRLKFQ